MRGPPGDGDVPHEEEHRDRPAVALPPADAFDLEMAPLWLNPMEVGLLEMRLRAVELNVQLLKLKAVEMATYRLLVKVIVYTHRGHPENMFYVREDLSVSSTKSRRFRDMLLHGDPHGLSLIKRALGMRFDGIAPMEPILMTDAVYGAARRLILTAISASDDSVSEPDVEPPNIDSDGDDDAAKKYRHLQVRGKRRNMGAGVRCVSCGKVEPVASTAQQVSVPSHAK